MYHNGQKREEREEREGSVIKRFSLHQMARFMVNDMFSLSH